MTKLMNTTKKLFLCGLSLCLLTPVLKAQSYAINWYAIANGGGTSAATNGSIVYSVSGTIGQADAGGTMTGSGYALTGGFWSMISAVQTVNAPLLTVTHAGSTVVVSWPLSTGFTLQQTPHLWVTNWTASTNTITTNAGVESITISTAPSGSLYFRLSGP
jgi:hypothetical protein